MGLWPTNTARFYKQEGITETPRRQHTPVRAPMAWLLRQLRLHPDHGAKPRHRRLLQRRPLCHSTNAYEVSFAYLTQKRLTSKLTGFVDVGGGILGFLPIHRGDTAASFVPGKQQFLVPSYQTRPVGVAAVGIDLRLTQRLALRAEYRGLLFKFPDWSNGSVAKNITETSQPTLTRLPLQKRSSPIQDRNQVASTTTIRATPHAIHTENHVHSTKSPQLKQHFREPEHPRHAVPRNVRRALD